MKKTIIAIEGLDGTGKHTQATKLAEHVGWELRSFPTYNKDSVFARPCEAYLKGAFGNNPDIVNPYACATFYAIDRYESFMNDWGDLYKKGKNFIMDRYTESNIICHLHKFHDDAEKLKQMRGILQLEANMGIPTAEVVLFLDVDPEVSAKLMTSRYNGNEAAKDIHERSIDLQKKFRESARFAAKHDARWVTIDCMTEDGTNIKSIEDIHSTIMQRLYNMGYKF